MKLLIIPLLLFLIMFPVVFVSADVVQETEGNDSPAIKAGRDVIYNKGLSKEDITYIIDYFVKIQKTTMDEWKTLDRYELKNGLIRDTKTGLMWMRCSIGKVWKKSACKGTAKEYFWDDVIELNDVSIRYAGYDDWRLPTIEELQTLIHCGFHASLMDDPCKHDNKIPRIMKLVFPDADFATGTSFWWASSDEISYCNDYACFVERRKKASDEAHYVRLVREDY